VTKLILFVGFAGTAAFASGCSGGAAPAASRGQGGDGGADAAVGNLADGGTPSQPVDAGGTGGSGTAGVAGIAGIGGSPVDAGADGPVTGVGGGAGMPGVAGAGGAIAAAGAGGGAVGGQGGMAGAGGSMVVTEPACSDMFDQTLQAFSIDISADDWAAIQSEFITAAQLPDSMFVQYEPAYYPVVFHYGSETVSDAYIRLKGDSSWREAAMYDGQSGKMQLKIAFDHVNSKSKFHGVDKIGLDMPRTDPTFMRERIANAWLRSIGVPAICATNATLTVNGSLYGVFVAEEHVNHQFVTEWFPDNSSGDLFKGGWTPETNTSNPNWTRLDTFWAASTAADLSSIVDVPNSLLAWAAECLLNNGDGYWGGDHNFYIYDQGASGYVFFPTDLDSSLDYLGQFTSDPIYWWSARNQWLLPIPQHYLIMVGDPALRAQYTQAVATQLSRLNVSSS